LLSSSSSSELSQLRPLPRPSNAKSLRELHPGLLSTNLTLEAAPGAPVRGGDKAEGSADRPMKEPSFDRDLDGSTCVAR
jgi:hypothetical protein